VPDGRVTSRLERNPEKLEWFSSITIGFRQFLDSSNFVIEDGIEDVLDHLCGAVRERVGDEELDVGGRSRTGSVEVHIALTLL